MDLGFILIDFLYDFGRLFNFFVCEHVYDSKCVYLYDATCAHVYNSECAAAIFECPICVAYHDFPEVPGTPMFFGYAVFLNIMLFSGAPRCPDFFG